MKTTALRSQDIEQKWYLIDCSEKTLGRLSVRVANILRGKTKPEYTPNADVGDFVILINAKNIKVTGSKTDDKVLPEDSKNLNERPEVENLLGIYGSLSDQNLETTINEFSGKNFSEFKIKLSELVVEKIFPISSEINKLYQDKEFIDKILSDGAEKADKIASKKVQELKKIVGF